MNRELYNKIKLNDIYIYIYIHKYIYIQIYIYIFNCPLVDIMRMIAAQSGITCTT